MNAGGFDARELDYVLPEERIAQEPLGERDAARLLCVERHGERLRHARVRDLPELLPPSLIVLNDTRVLPARLLGQKPSGGKFELLLIERSGAEGMRERWSALGKGLRPGQRFELGGGLLRGCVHGRDQRELELELESELGVAAALERVGSVPIPPYIKRPADARDAERYQTVFAAHTGAVAAPTAGLHLSQALLASLADAGHELAFVTLHVGPGTFAPLRSDNLAQHAMHPERYVIPEATAQAAARARQQGRQLLAVGTTVVRALESAVRADGSLAPGPGATALFIYPPFRFRAVDALMTNFHLPRSTLLALCMAFGGVLALRRAYAEAIAAGYRFYSYGDAMLIQARV